MPPEVLEKMGGTPCEACQHATVPDGIDNMPCANPDCRRAGIHRHAPVVVTADIPVFTEGGPNDIHADEPVPNRVWRREKWRLGREEFWTWKEVAS